MVVKLYILWIYDNMHSAALPTLRQEKNIFITLRVIVGDLKINLTGTGSNVKRALW